MRRPHSFRADAVAIQRILEAESCTSETKLLSWYRAMDAGWSIGFVTLLASLRDLAQVTSEGAV